MPVLTLPALTPPAVGTSVAGTPPATYTVQTVTTSGSLVARLTHALVTSVRWELNGAGTVTFTLNTNDPQCNAIDLTTGIPGTEIQVYRNATLLFWGVVTRARAGKKDTEFQGQGLLWYFSRRFIGKPRTNYLLNPSFETGTVGSLPTSWTNSSVTTAAIVTNNDVLGSRAVQLNENTSGLDHFIYQGVATSYNASAPFVLSAWVYISSAHWVGPAVDNFGLAAVALNGVTAIGYWNVPIDDSTPQDQWVRLSMQVGRPPGVTSIQVRLYAPGSWTVWDAVQLVLPESLSYPNTDQGEIIESLSVHGQSTAENKSSLNIGRSHTVTGVVRNRTWQFDDHQNYLDAMKEFVGVQSGVDIDVAITSSTRTLTVYYPQKGVVSPTVTLTYPGSGLTDFSLDVDGERVSTSVTLLSNTASGPDREEFNSTDASSLAGLILEAIETGPTGSVVNDLSSIAALRLSQLRKPLKIVSVTTADTSLIGSLVVGDNVTLSINYGWVQFSATQRVVAIDLNPRTETMVLTLNEAPS